MSAAQLVIFLVVSQGIMLVACGNGNKARVFVNISAHNVTPGSGTLSYTLEEKNLLTEVLNLVSRSKKIPKQDNKVIFPAFPMEYTFNVPRSFRFTFTDSDKGTPTEFDLNLGELVSGREGKIDVPAQHGDGEPYISFTTAETSKADNMLALKIIGINVLESGMPENSKTYLVISRPEEVKEGEANKGQENYDRIYFTELQTGPAPTWKIVVPYEHVVIKSDPSQQVLRFKLYTYGEFGNRLLGKLESKYTELEAAAKQGKVLSLTSEYNDGYRGQIKIEVMKRKEGNTFIQTLQKHGIELDFIVFFDWTQSNQAENRSWSLHDNRPGALNQYVQATTGLGGVLQDYDHDKMVDAWGFGGWEIKNKIQTDATGKWLPPIVFPLKGLNKNPACNRVKEVLEAYKGAFALFEFWGPTNFVPVIAEALKKVEKFKGSKQYFVLVITTDGEISDMDATKKAIIESCEMNFSIIIVGIYNPYKSKAVNDTTFKSMVELDGDGDTPLTIKTMDSSIRSTRDNVQFTCTEEYFDQNLIGSGPGKKFATTKHAQKAFTEDVLLELPGNVNQKMMTPVGVD